MIIRERIQSVILSNLSQSDGSALYSFGDTVIQSSLFGPSEVTQQKENCSKATVEVIYKKPIRSLNRDNKDIKLIEKFISNNVETIIHSRLHPRTLVTVVLQEIQNSGSLMASSLNSLCFSLLDSGFPLKYLLAATSAVVTTEGEVIVNANDEDTNNAKASFTIVFDSIDCKIISIITEGNFTFSQFQQSVDVCKQTAKEIFQFYRLSIQKRFND